MNLEQADAAMTGCQKDKTWAGSFPQESVLPVGKRSAAGRRRLKPGGGAKSAAIKPPFKNTLCAHIYILTRIETKNENL